jgi:transcriptional regulator of arginine metabolism
MSKASRQKAILAVVDQGPVASQEELQRSLHKRGFKVGQATLSRDIRDLGLAKTAEG